MRSRKKGFKQAGEPSNLGRDQKTRKETRRPGARNRPLARRAGFVQTGAPSADARIRAKQERGFATHLAPPTRSAFANAAPSTDHLEAPGPDADARNQSSTLQR